jgi:hypothetical protein
MASPIVSGRSLQDRRNTFRPPCRAPRPRYKQCSSKCLLPLAAASKPVSPNTTKPNPASRTREAAADLGIDPKTVLGRALCFCFCFRALKAERAKTRGKTILVCQAAYRWRSATVTPGAQGTTTQATVTPILETIDSRGFFGAKIEGGRYLIQPHHPPVNIIGGYKFPDAPVIDLSPAPEVPVVSKWQPPTTKWRYRSPCAQVSLLRMQQVLPR